MCVRVRVCLCEPPGAEVSHMLPTSEESFTHKAEFSDTKFTVKKKKKRSSTVPEDGWTEELS